MTGSFRPRPAPVIAMDRRTAGLAFDRSSVRTFSKDGHLHVAITPISKANVCPYYGREIPDYEALNLDADKVYFLLRDPEELARAASTFNGKPLLLIHKPVSADDHPRQITIGATGTDAVFEKPYLKNSLAVWDAEGIAFIEGEDPEHQRKELSSAYHYRADMTPGEFEGEAFDGVMRDIEGNHVAIVEEGRAGSDVVVGDSKPKGLRTMKIKTATPRSRKALLAQGAVAVYLAPKLASDAQIDIGPLFKGVNRKNFAAKRAGIVAGITKVTNGKLAQDADLEDIVEFIDAIQGVGDDDDADEVTIDADIVEGAVAAPDPESTNKGMGADDDEMCSKLKAAGFDDATCAKIMEALKPAATDGDPPMQPGAEPPMKDEDKPMSKGAMDTAIKLASDKAIADTVKRMNAIAEARDTVRPLIGAIEIAQDSAEAIFKMALDAKEVDLTDVHPSAYKGMVKLLLAHAGSDTQPREQKVAMDAKQAASLLERFPDASRVKTL